MRYEPAAAQPITVGVSLAGGMVSSNLPLVCRRCRVLPFLLSSMAEGGVNW